MADRTITSMNSTLVLTHPVLFPAGVQIYGFSTDAAIAADDAEKTVAQKGVDNRMSVGRVPYIVAWTITLSPDSPSNDVFDAIEAYEKVQREASKIRFVLSNPSLNEVRTLSDSVITNYNPIPPHGRTLGARAYKIASGECDRVVTA